jgi:prepilin-type N-terminal cleavage/methylation domain-containing protein
MHLNATASPAPSPRSQPGFSVIEMLACVIVLTIVASVAIKMTASTQASIQSAKLTGDVQKLNEVVSVYLANGGNLTGSTPQAILDQLKTVTTATQATQNVGVMTGRGVDTRLVALMQTSAETGSSKARALWDNAKKRFIVSTNPGTQGVSNFAFNNDLAASAVSYDANRAQSNFTYNNTVGWVWAPGVYAPGAFLDATTQTPIDQENKYNPLLAGSGSGSTTSDSIPVLPAPIASPSSAAYWPSTFPTAIYLNNNGAPDGTSILKYKVNDGGWTIYTGPFPISPGSTVTSKSFSTDSTLYADSPPTVERFFTLATNFTGTVNAYWSNQTNFNGNGAAVSGSPGQTGAPAVFVFNQFGSFSNEPASFGGVSANSLFQLGHLVYHNGNITGAYLNGEYIPVNGTTLLTLHLDITLTQPAGFSGSAEVDLTIEASADGSNAKLILNNPKTNFTFLYGGVRYTLNCQFDNPDVHGSTHLMGAFVGEIPL